jgi:PAS domain S-box-containing protein
MREHAREPEFLPDYLAPGPEEGDLAGAEDQLKTERDFISAVLDTVGALIVVLDRGGRIVLFNEACERVTGYSFEEVAGKHFWDLLLVPAEVEPVKGVFSELRAGFFPNEYVNYWVTKAGERRLISWSNTALLGREGSVAYVIGTGIDITDREELEGQLRQSQKMEAVGRLAGGVAHDFGSVLTAINGYTSRALQQIDEGHPAHADLREITRASERATDLIRRLMIFSRNREVEPTVLDLNVIIGELSQMLRRVIADNIDLETDLRAGDARVWADRSQVEQVLLNLAVNARDAMPSGGTVKIETMDTDLDGEFVHAHPDSNPGSYVLLRVTDTGTGMDDDVSSRAFEPFFTTKEEGTGLGLSTVYGIVKQCGGHISIESAPSAGAVFKIFIPHAAKAADPRAGSDS